LKKKISRHKTKPPKECKFSASRIAFLIPMSTRKSNVMKAAHLWQIKIEWRGIFQIFIFIAKKKHPKTKKHKLLEV